MSARILGLVDDLIFASRIQLEAEQAGAAFHRVGTTAAFGESLKTERPSLIIVDLDGMGFDGVAALEALRDEPAADGVPRIAFGSHVDADRLAAARDAGAESMARSQFVKSLPALVRG